SSGVRASGMDHRRSIAERDAGRAVLRRPSVSDDAVLSDCRFFRASDVSPTGTSTIRLRSSSKDHHPVDRWLDACFPIDYRRLCGGLLAKSCGCTDATRESQTTGTLLS